jgi:hypothetical protein
VDLRISRWHQAVVHGRDWDIDLAQGSRRALFGSLPTTARRTLDGRVTDDLVSENASGSLDRHARIVFGAPDGHAARLVHCGCGPDAHPF